jgi:uncharacterized SAM-binding protein YcdF (DUF218 family)
MKNILLRCWSYCIVRLMVISFSLLILLALFREPLFKGVGSFLFAADPVQPTEACFILGGNSYERGMAGVLLHNTLPDMLFYPTGGNFPLQIQALDTMMTEAQLTAHLMVRRGVTDSLVHPLNIGTSTMEESDGILAFCKEKGLKKITVISSALHLRRVRWVFEDKFRKAGIEVVLHGSNAQDFNSTDWWKSEEGLILGQNELVKLIYYFFKY